MAVFSRYANVTPEQESDFDADTRWALAWFDHYGMLRLSLPSSAP